MFTTGLGLASCSWEFLRPPCCLQVLLLENWSLLSSPCSAWHCWGNCSCCVVLHVGGLFSLQRSGVYFLHLPSFSTCLFFGAGGCLKFSVLLPMCWRLGRAARGCRGEGAGCTIFPLLGNSLIEWNQILRLGSAPAIAEQSCSCLAMCKMYVSGCSQHWPLSSSC